MQFLRGPYKTAYFVDKKVLIYATTSYHVEMPWRPLFWSTGENYSFVMASHYSLVFSVML